MATDDEIREYFTEMGLCPKKVALHEQTGRYMVNIGVEGTDDRFLTDSDGGGSEEPVKREVSPATLRQMENEIDGGQIQSGTVQLVGTMKGCHFRINIE